LRLCGLLQAGPCSSVLHGVAVVRSAGSWQVVRCADRRETTPTAQGVLQRTRPDPWLTVLVAPCPSELLLLLSGGCPRFRPPSRRRGRHSPPRRVRPHCPLAWPAGHIPAGLPSSLAERRSRQKSSIWFLLAAACSRRVRRRHPDGALVRAGRTASTSTPPGALGLRHRQRRRGLTWGFPIVERIARGE